MKTPHRMAIFNDKYPLIGPVLWILSLQYYLTQLLVGLAWANAYSWLFNTISDLGNTVCGTYGGRYVCSPGRDWMNASFVVLGATMIAGSGLIYQEFRRSTFSRIGFGMMALAGLGTILVGVFPENTVAPLHFLGALLPFIFGNVAMIILGLTLELPFLLRTYSVLSGLVALAALGLFISHTYLGLGIGGMERVVAYPQSIWLIFFGLYMSRARYKARRRLQT